MNGIEAIKAAYATSEGFVMSLLEDLSETPLEQPSNEGGNHALWILGHLALSHASFKHIMLGEKSPIEDWQQHFGMGTEPHTDASKYPSWEEAWTQFKEARTSIMEFINTLSDEDLDKASTNPPEGSEAFFATHGQVLLLGSMHEMIHAGQLADIRRRLGKKPLMA